MLYYQSRNALMSASVSAADLRVGNPVSVLELDAGVAIGMDTNGRFLVDRRRPPATSALVLTLEWLREIRAQLGPPPAAVMR
jgi:hypothetical protein